MSWHKIPLKNLGQIIGGGTPSTKEPLNFGDDYPWITPKDLSRQGQRYIDHGERGISIEGLTRSSAKLLPAGSVIVSSRAPIGLIAIATVPVTTNQGCRSFVPGRDADSLFMYYLLGSMTDQMERLANGSTFKEISGSTLAAIEVSVPEIEEQRAIAGTLGALDDKIESNRRTVELIEQLLVLEFQKLLRKETVEFRKLSELTTIIKGVSYKSVDLKQSSTSLVTLKSFDRTGGYKADGLKQYIGPYKQQQIIEPGEVVVALTDLTQGAEVVGRAVRVPAVSSAEVLVASLDLAIVRPKPELSPEYLLGILVDKSFREHCRSRTSGTTVLHLASDAIPNYMAPFVSAAAQQNFSTLSRPLLARADSLNIETFKLESLRDALLPELISGRIHVPTAPEAVS